MGLRTFDTDSCNDVLELMTIVEGRVILMVVAFTSPHVRLEFTNGNVIAHSDPTLGTISLGNYIKTTDCNSIDDTCCMVNW